MIKHFYAVLQRKYRTFCTIKEYCRSTHTCIFAFLFFKTINKTWNKYIFPDIIQKEKDVVYQTSDGESSEIHPIFVHSVTNNPELAFAENTKGQDFDSWHITTDEFSKFLYEIYNRGYILTKMHDLLNGQLTVPAGKIPVVFSFDDMNYYDSMKGFGFAERISADSNGKFVFPVVTATGTENKFEGDSIGILEHFIAEHPDFSLNGARGTIALTGYEGALGYRDLNNPELARVVDALKAAGYEFACHSWGHHHRIYNDTNPDGVRGIRDMKKWFRGVGDVIGKTDIFITPFGVDIRHNPILHRYLKEKGFRYFLSVGRKRTASKKGKCFYLSRMNFDGISMRQNKEYYKRFYCDPENVYDKKRRVPLYAPKDNGSFVAYAEYCLSIPTVYLWDTRGDILTGNLINETEHLYPRINTPEEWKSLFGFIDGKTRAFDCSGLIKRFLMGGFQNYRYDRSLDKNSAQMYEEAETKGEIGSLPEIPGICLYMEGHVGIYAGNGRVIEATPNPKFGNGVVETKIADRNWENWFFVNEIEYGTEK